MPLGSDRHSLDDRHVDLAPVAGPYLSGEHRQVIILEGDRPVVDLPAHCPVTHVGTAPGNKISLGQDAVHRFAGRRPGKEVDLELFAALGPADKFLRDELGVAGCETGNEEIRTVLDVPGRRLRICYLVE